MPNKLFIILTILFTTINSYAQKAPQLRIIARADSTTGNIHLRWAATNAIAWKKCNQYGFKLERYTILHNKQTAPNLARKVLGKGIIKAKPLNEWKTIAENNMHAAVIAQAIFGKDFEVSSTKGVTQIVAQSRELEQRFAFSLQAADMSFDAAMLAGWGLVDTTANRNEKYLYRLTTAAPANILKPDTTSVFISPSEYEPLPVIDDVIAHFGNRTVMLNWDYSHLQKNYTSYFVEKSNDQGKTFKRIEGAPISNFNSKEGSANTRMYFVDSLSHNNVEYQYRIVGINSFGQEGPRSTPVIGQGHELLAFVPSMETGFIDHEGILHLKWFFEEQANDLIKGFILNRSDKSSGKYQIFTDTLQANQRTYTSKKPLESTNYFTITAIPKHGEERTSFPLLVQAVDSIPPAIPEGLKAVMDTSGVVTLTWNPNTEKDLMGYKIYQALKEGEEPVPLTDSVWLSNQFEAKLNLSLLNRKAWYAITALDQRANQSPLSALVEVKKPSTIPPSPAVFTKYELKADSITLNWINSYDEDITHHNLFRKASKDSTFTQIFQYPKQQNNTYTDLALQAGERYTYYIQSQNKGDLTTPSELLEIKIPTSASSKKEITRLYAHYQKDKHRILISWDDELTNVAEYQLYRAIKGTPLIFWQTVTPPQKGLYDTDVQTGVEYEYAVMAVSQSGAYSVMKKISIKL